LVKPPKPAELRGNARAGGEIGGKRASEKEVN